MLTLLLRASFVTGLLCSATLSAQDDPTFRVFVLAGQSNMEGKAQNILWDRQADDPETAAFFAPYRDEAGWKVRDDVFVDFLGRRGPLTLGFGSPGRSGVELAFGEVVGEHFDEPVLLIKAAWGGKSIHKDFRPPSAGLPSAAELEAELEARRRQVKQRIEKTGRDEPLPTIDDVRSGYGKYWRDMVAAVRDGIAAAGENFPALEGRRPVLSGLVWFQGWNDQYQGYEQHYEENLAHFVRDVRAALDAPDLPIVIGVMGQNGSKPAAGAMQVIQDAQLAVGARDDLGPVVAVRTDALVDAAAEALYPQWKERREEWDRTGSDHPYHYLGSAIWFTRIGRECAAALLRLQRG